MWNGSQIYFSEYHWNVRMQLLKHWYIYILFRNKLSLRSSWNWQCVVTKMSMTVVIWASELRSYNSRLEPVINILFVITRYMYCSDLLGHPWTWQKKSLNDNINYQGFIQIAQKIKFGSKVFVTIRSQAVRTKLTVTPLTHPRMHHLWIFASHSRWRHWTTKCKS